MAYRDPVSYEFSETDREKFEDRAWHCPIRLVTAGDDEDPSVWAGLWRGQSKTRGCGSAISVLPVLALHTWPTRDKDDLRQKAAAAKKPLPDRVGPSPEWTPWSYLSTRRIAALAGINKDSVQTAYRALEAAGLAQTYLAPKGGDELAPGLCYRLSTRLYCDGPEVFAPITGTLVYGGMWAMLPTPATRHLYLTLACLDSIQDEAAWTRAAVASGDTEKRVALRIQELREGDRYSLADLTRLSGLPESTILEARPLLLSPTIYNGAALFQRESGTTYTATWYRRDPEAAEVYWTPSVLNDPAQRERAQRNCWPEFFLARDARQKKRQRAAAKRAATAKRAKATPAPVRPQLVVA